MGTGGITIESDSQQWSCANHFAQGSFIDVHSKENTVVVILILGAPMKSQDIGNNFLIRGERGVLFLKELTSYIITLLTVNRKVRVVVTGRQGVQFNQKLPPPGVCTALHFCSSVASQRHDATSGTSSQPHLFYHNYNSEHAVLDLSLTVKVRRRSEIFFGTAERSLLR